MSNKPNKIVQIAKVAGSNSKVTKKQVPTAWKERINVEDYEGLRDIFLLFDQDGSGVMDPQEVVKVLEELGLDKRNPYVVNIVWALRQTNKNLTFDEFVDVVCSKVGQNYTKDGLKRVFAMYTKDESESIGFQQLKHIARFIGQTLTDDDLLELMHSVFITHKTGSNEEITFDEFYQVIAKYHERQKEDKMLRNN